LEYPEWAMVDPAIAGRPVWVEAATYVGVVGGSGYDYLAYLAYLREKSWGQSARPDCTGPELAVIAGDPGDPNRVWVRAIWVDCTLSFAAVLLFSAVFVAGGAIVLGPQERVPGGNDLLTLQAEFVAAASPWLRPVYFAGAFLTMLGTLYGTIEVAPAVLRELLGALGWSREQPTLALVRRRTISWVSAGGGVVLLFIFGFHLARGGGNPPGLIAMLTPANLFTGVLSCGIIGWLAVWADRRFLPAPLRPSVFLTGLNLVGGTLFVALGIKGYWDHSRWAALPVFVGTLAVGWLAAVWLEHRRRGSSGG
jgi:hypothetical protein